MEPPGMARSQDKTPPGGSITLLCRDHRFGRILLRVAWPLLHLEELVKG